MAEHQRALARGDVDAIVATFEPDGYAREPAGGGYVHAAGAALADAARLTRATGAHGFEALVRVELSELAACAFVTRSIRLRGGAIPAPSRTRASIQFQVIGRREPGSTCGGSAEKS